MTQHRRWLLPLTPLYRFGLALRERSLATGREPIRRLKLPVVSIGNLSTGGAGKTPLAIALAQALTRRAIAVDILSRGYGRQSRLPARVLPDGAASEYGDEPLLIARATGAPVFVAPQRYDAGQLAESETRKPQIHILDDGFQHRQLHRDIDILLLNRDDWHDRLLPAGNLREPLQAIRRASVLAIPADDPEFASDLRAGGCQRPIWLIRRMMDTPSITTPVAAFCGIARPSQFFAGLEAAGLRLAARTAFPDHHPYTTGDVECLSASARAAQATALLTTEKDVVRLGPLVSSFPPSLPLLTAKLRLEIEQESAAIDWLLGALNSTAPQPSL